MTELILVSGGAGYIGSHVCKVLHGAGMIPVVLDDLSSGRRDFVRWGPLIEGCASDEMLVKSALEQYDIRAVIDLAAFIDSAESVTQPAKYYCNNVEAKRPFLRALQACEVKAVVISSTAAVYGEPGTEFIAETHPLKPTTPYGASKAAYESMLSDMHAQRGPSFIALRYFNAAGAHEQGDIGECHDPETHLIARACMAALGQISELEIFGNDYSTLDGTAIRDYVHVTDLAHAHVKALQHLLKGASPKAYNLGSGTGTSVQEIMGEFEKKSILVPHRFSPRRAGDASKLVANISLAERDLGWKPIHGISDIIESAYRWHSRLGSEARTATRSGARAGRIGGG